MQDFARRAVDVLVCTTVIEVGVDVANATTIVLLDADRFGVSQLHQLRGRVGRGGLPGLCLLVSHAEQGSPAMDRLQAVAATTDGFELSRIDLEQRREGDVLGASQSGLRSSLDSLRVLRDEKTIVAARAAAEEMVAADPTLEPLAVARRRGGRLGAGQQECLHGAFMTRIIGGTAGGRRLTTPRGQHTRPTSDRVREALFSAVEAWCGSLAGLRFLDLYAGSGAVGLEARSRGRGRGDAGRARPAHGRADLRQRQGTRLRAGRGARRQRRQHAGAHPGGAVRRGLHRPALPGAQRRGRGSAAGPRRPRLAVAGLPRRRRALRAAGRRRPGPSAIEPGRDKRYGETLLRYGHAATHSSPQE